MSISRPILYIFAFLFMAVIAFFIGLKEDWFVSKNHAQSTVNKNNTALNIAEDAHYVPEQLPDNYFIAPLHGNLTLAGSFAELRANHFHSGLDFRTGGVEGKAVLASADGFVARIRIGPYGFGKALYLAHPNGYTTVYGHLKNFNGAIESFAIAKQYETESFDQELYLPANTLKVKKGDTIAWSGNTGGSGGAHLHFEIRKSSNDQIINPLLFGLKIKDSMQPFLKSILLVKINEELKNTLGYYPERISRQAPALKKSKEVLQLQPAKYGLAFSSVDYFTDFASRLGINYAILYADGVPVFEHTIEHYLFAETRYINTHLDYAYYREKGVRYARMFQVPGNKLDFYGSYGDGTFSVENGKTLHLKLEIRDYAGLVDSLVVDIIGNAETKAISIPSVPTYPVQWKVVAKESNKFSTDLFKVSAAAGYFMDDAVIGYEQRQAPKGALSKMHALYGAKIPLFKPMSISIKAETPISDPNKYVIIYKDPMGGGIACENGTYQNGWVSTTVKNIGYYFLMADSIAPHVVPQSFQRNLIFHISDNLSGISSFDCRVDGKWVLLEYDYKNGKLWGKIPKSIPSGKHILELIVKDKTGNSTKINRNIAI